MSHTHTDRIAQEMSLAPRQVAATLALIAEGATIPFMARYRKEVTGNLDEVQLAQIRDRADQLAQLDKRREAILKSLEERDLLTETLREAVETAATLTELEDLYLPYRPKRRTRATMAREKGLEPLAEQVRAQDPSLDPEAVAAAFVDAEKGVADVAEALQGARDIIAEQISEDKEARERVRQHFRRDGIVSSRVIRGKEEEGAKFKDYFEWSEPIAQIPSHRLLALRRGEKELILSLSIRPEEEQVLETLERLFVRGDHPAAAQVREAVHDGYKRLMAPSLETEIRVQTKDKADEEAIRVFADNLRQLLLAPPLGSKRVLAVDPGFRTGCKLVALDAQGNLLAYEAIFPHPPQRKVAMAEAVVQDWISRYQLEAIAIGNGTAGRETEAFFREIDLPAPIPIIMVNESGASVYSASEVAREEFPDYDLTVRGAVSIGRRLTDPLAELVKIDPKSIGVGQYQHDVDQTLLKKGLDDTVMSCVNGVGVEVNTASKQLLAYVSGLGPALAENIVRHRADKGPFASRQQLLQVPRLGPKAFEQAAGFLRIRNGAHPLDASAVHPESYPIVEQMAQDLGVTVPDLIADEKRRQLIDLKRYVTDTVGLPTLQDILTELAKPGRDPREQFEVFTFAEGINDITDLREGMVLPGIVTNVTNFGAFVDVGVHQDGLVHLSQLANRYVKHPSEVVKVQQKVQVRVVSIDLPRRRIGLSMKDENAPAPPSKKPARNRQADVLQSEHIRIKRNQRRK